MRRGDIITVSLPGDYGKPRPALVIQNDQFSILDSLTVLPMTSFATSIEPPRIAILPSSTNGLRAKSQIMVEKITTLPRSKAGSRIGELSSDDLAQVHQSLALFLGFA